MKSWTLPALRKVTESWWYLVTTGLNKYKNVSTQIFSVCKWSHCSVAISGSPQTGLLLWVSSLMVWGSAEWGLVVCAGRLCTIIWIQFAKVCTISVKVHVSHSHSGIESAASRRGHFAVSWRREADGSALFYGTWIKNKVGCMPCWQ